MSTNKDPCFFSADLKEERLIVIAEELLRVLDNTYTQLSTSS